MKNRSKKSTIVLSALFLALVLIGVYAAGVFQIYHINSRMKIPETGHNLVAELKLDEENMFATPSGQRVSFDMGSRHCFINESTLEHFKQVGYPIREVPTLAFTIDPNGHHRVFTRKVTMPMLLTAPNQPDSIIRIDDCELFIVDDSNENVLGMDFISRFVVGYKPSASTVSIYRSVPDGYVTVSEINSHDSNLGDMLGYSRRVYIPLEVNDEHANNYYFDTGANMSKISMIQPINDIRAATSEVRLDSASGLYYQDYCRVLIGNRLRYARVVYSDTIHTDYYSINPFRLFNQSVIIDIPGKRLMFKKDSDVSRPVPPRPTPVRKVTIPPVPGDTATAK